MRKNQTPSETVMWELLRNRQFMNLKFRRQHQIGDYIVDFFCNEEKLVIELDGAVHKEEKQFKKDVKRTAYLESQGFKVLRFENSEFIANTKVILEQIKTSIQDTSSTLYTFPSTFGRGARGEGKNRISTDGINSLYSMISGLFNQHTLRDVIRNFIYFPDTSKKEEKILCRYPQYYATIKLYENIKLHCKVPFKEEEITQQELRSPDGKGGTYFGATGCGKSFTMLFLTRMLMKCVDFASPTIIIITDRTDLDDQISAQFTNAKGYIGDESVICVENRESLRTHLKGRNSGGVFLTTIHKFTEDTKVLTERSNVICISDEAHRSQINLDQKLKVTEAGVKRTYV